ncbi:hypothetical protein ABW19_dt0210344 [Dactylella cylindrospora]|nr:hypothetical protein ABW19_dt0210344 [Dactylella cylindrospora]
MAYTTQNSAIPPPPSPSPYSRLPTPAGSHFGRPHASRSISTSAYSSSHPSPSRPTLPPHATSYDSFAPQSAPSPSPSKLPGFGLQRPGSTVDSVHRRRGSVAEKTKIYEKLDETIPRSPSTVSSTVSGFGYGAAGQRTPGGLRRDSVTGGVAPSPRSGRIGSRPPSYVETGSSREHLGDIGNHISDPRRHQTTHLDPRRSSRDYESQASPAPIRRSLGLLGEPNNTSQLKENVQKDPSQLMPPPPTLIRQFSTASSSNLPLEKVARDISPQPSLKPPSPLPQIPTPSPRKGTHVRAQSHHVAPVSRPPPRATSTRPTDPRPTSTVGSKTTGPGRPPSTLHSVPSARPRAASHNIPSGPDVRRISTPANDLSLPKGSRSQVGRAIAPPRSTSTRPNEPTAPSSASLRRPTTTRPRPTSGQIPQPGISTSRGSDSEPSIRSESVASTTSNNSSARSDITTKPKQPISRPTTAKPIQDPQSPQRRSPTRGHRKNGSISAPKSSRPAFNTYKVEYTQAYPTSKPTTASLMHTHTNATSTHQPTDILHTQTRLLQLSILHAQSFDSTASLRKSAHKKLYKRFSEIKDRNSQVAESHRREQELADLYALSLVLKRPAVNSLGVGNWRDKLSSSPEEAIQSLSEQLSKVLAWFTEGQFEGEYTRMVRIFEEWISLPDTHERKIDGLGSDYGRDIIRVRRKMEMALRGLEGWMVLIVEGEKAETGDEAPALRGALGRILTVAVGRLKAGLEELTMIQKIEKTVVTTIRKELRKKIVEIMDGRKEIDLQQQKTELAAWQPAWTMS